MITNEIPEDFELIAKRCPSCQSLVMAKLEKKEPSGVKYSSYICSKCDWKSPMDIALAR